MIIDQCQACENTECDKSIIFDGQSCPSFVSNPITGEYLKENTQISGWLIFCLISIVGGGISGLIYPIVTFNPIECYGSNILAITDIILGIFLFVFAIKALYSFIARKPNAVFLAKTYTIAVLATNLIALWGGNFNFSGWGSTTFALANIFWSFVWLLFLTVSEEVKTVIPPAYRGKSKLDYILLSALIIIPATTFTIGLIDVFGDHSKDEEEFLQHVVLKDNEYTDGRMVFTVPEGYTCEAMDADGNKFFNIKKEGVASITLFSVYESQQDPDIIDQYWNAFYDKESENYPQTYLLDEINSINGYIYQLKTTEYQIADTTSYWRFAMLFDKYSIKVCVLSCVDIGNDEYLDKILGSIRFDY